MPTINPQNDHQTQREAISKVQLERARVDEVVGNPEDGQTVYHTVVVEPYSDGPVTAVPVAVGADGDVRVPPEGSTVLIARRKGDRPVILDTLYAAGRDTPPEYDPGDRRLVADRGVVELFMHADGTLELQNDDDVGLTVRSDGSIRLNTQNGTLDVEDGGTVRVNGGSQPVVTDVSVSTTKDADGHVTDVSLSLTTDSSLQV